MCAYKEDDFIVIIHNTKDREARKKMKQQELTINQRRTWIEEKIAMKQYEVFFFSVLHVSFKANKN